MKRLFFYTIVISLASATIISEAQTNSNPENHYTADKGNGYYQNPVLPGRYGDPSLIRDGENFYMIHSGGRGYGFLIWHSHDLVNWQAFTTVKTGDYGSPWAPDIVKVDGRYFIYVTQAKYAEDGSRSFENFVYHADKIEGPWQGPVNLHVKGLIDPGHLTAIDGKRYLYLEKGMVIELSKDGLSTKGNIQKVYDGWNYPEDWIVECPCLEGPKFLHKDGYYYLVSALGGTSGPATSHMASIARSKSPLGPWIESPYNPLIHTYSQAEQWWSQGHATLIDDIEGNWWAIYHAYEKDARHLSRQTLLLPVAWTNDGWPIIKDGIAADAMIKKPAGKNIGNGMLLSDNFISDKLGFQWRTSDNLSKIHTGEGKLVIDCDSASIKGAIKLGVSHVNKNFEVRVKVAIEDNTEGGLMLGNTGVGLHKGNPGYHPEEKVDWDAYIYSAALYENDKLQMNRAGELPPLTSNTIYYKIRAINGDVIVYWSEDGADWHKFARSFRSSNLAPTLFAFGKGKVVFSDFVYLGLD